MPLETAIYISELVPTNPAPGDLKAQGDDHIRMEKRVLKTAFAGIPGVVYITGTDGGAANAYTVAPVDPVPAYGVRMLIAFAPTVANTGACTLAVGSLGAKALVTASGDPLVAGDLLAGVVQTAIYDGAQFRLLAVTKAYVDRGDAANLAYTKQADADLRTYIDSLAFSTALPNQSLGFLRSDDTNAAFTRTHTGYAQNEVRGADIASAATINLTTATGNFVHVTGTTTISAITIPAGAARELIFDSALTLVHGSGLLLPTGANIAVMAGDRAIVRGDSNGAVITQYQRANGIALRSGAVDLVASAVISSAVANVDFLSTFSADYERYLIEIEGFRPSANDVLALAFAVGGVVDTTIANYPGSTLPYYALGSTQIASDALGSTYSISLTNVSSNTRKILTIDGVYNGTGAIQTISGVNYYRSSNILSGFRLYFAAGASVFQGTVRIYGFKNTI